MIFLPVWLTGWTIVGVAAIGASLFHTKSPAPFLILWLCGWLLGEVMLTYIFCWMAFGKEIVKISKGELGFKRDLFGFGKIRTFAINSIQDLRAAGSFMNPFSARFTAMFEFWGLAGGNVAFDCNGKTQRFGIWLTEPEAKEVVAKLKPYLSIVA